MANKYTADKMSHVWKDSESLACLLSLPLVSAEVGVDMLRLPKLMRCKRTWTKSKYYKN